MQHISTDNQSRPAKRVSPAPAPVSPHITCDEIREKNSVPDENLAADLPGLAARHLLLDGHVRYTGPAMKRACAVWNADAGVTNLEIMMHLAWKNAFRASRYTSGSEAGQRHAVDHTTVNIGRGEGRGGIC